MLEVIIELLTGTEGRVNFFVFPVVNNGETIGWTDPGLVGAIIGAASVFMAYEGFQLLTYDYEDILNPKKTLPRAVVSAVVVVILVYVLEQLERPCWLVHRLLSKRKKSPLP